LTRQVPAPYFKVAVAENQPSKTKTALRTDTRLYELCSDVRAFIRGPQSDQVFDQLALDIFRFQFANNGRYRVFCQSSGQSPETVQSWRSIPAIITSAFKDFELTVLSAGERTAVFHSSGTTGQRPSRHFHSAETIRLYEDSLVAWFGPHVLPDTRRARFLILSPEPSQIPHSSLAHMFATVSKEFGTESDFVGQLAEDGSWLLNFEKIAWTLRTLSDPMVICGTAFSFVHWCDHLAQNRTRFSLPPGSRAFETGGYKGRSRTVPKEELHRLIEERLCIPQSRIISEYGMSELSSQAYDRVTGSKLPRVFQFPPWARPVIVSPETLREVDDSQTGLVRVYDLANVGSVMSIQTEDLAIRRGAGFELIGRAALAEPRGCSLMEMRS
jgi:hypothetical protein